MKLPPRATFTTSRTARAASSGRGGGAGGVDHGLGAPGRSTRSEAAAGAGRDGRGRGGERLAAADASDRGALLELRAQRRGLDVAGEHQHGAAWVEEPRRLGRTSSCAIAVTVGT